MIVENLKKHREHIRTSFCEAMEFKAFTELAYLFATKYIDTTPGPPREVVLGYSDYASEIGMSDQNIPSSELPAYFASVKEKYFLSMVHQQQIALFEHLFFDLIRILLVDKPERLPKKKQIDYATILESDTKDAIVWRLIDKELNEIKYKNVSEWFTYLNSLVRFPNIPPVTLEKVAEAKATRDILVHNAGIVNKIYLEKSGRAARSNVGSMIDISSDYTKDVWQLLVGVLITLLDSLIEKFEEKLPNNRDEAV
jgi:hypothetical protein